MDLPMQDQRTQSHVARQFDQTDRVVLELLLGRDFPGPWSVRELGQALGDEIAAMDAISELNRAGLMHRLEGFVFASWPAARYMRLADTA
jgi:hypothetical protein